MGEANDMGYTGYYLSGIFDGINKTVTSYQDGKSITATPNIIIGPEANTSNPVDSLIHELRICTDARSSQCIKI